MRIIIETTLKEYCGLSRYAAAKSSIQVWIYEVRNSEWRNPHELKAMYKHASIISSKRVVFDIKGNNYRLVVDIEYRLRIVYVVWFGTHEEYDKLDVRSIEYGK